MTDAQTTAEIKIDRIVCLDREPLYLFAEVIDIVPSTSRYWLRPLALARSHPESFNLEFLYDLRETAQLILPIELFRDALDTEVLPLISELFNEPKNAPHSTVARQALHEFIGNLFRSNPS